MRPFQDIVKTAAAIRRSHEAGRTSAQAGSPEAPSLPGLTGNAATRKAQDNKDVEGQVS